VIGPAVTANRRHRARDDDHRVTADGRKRARERRAFRKALAEKQADERREQQLQARRCAARSATVCCDCARPLSPTDSVTMVARTFGRNYDRFVALCLLCTLDRIKPLWRSDHPTYYFLTELRRTRCLNCRRPMRVFDRFFAPRFCCDDCRKAVRLARNAVRRRVRHEPKTCLKCHNSFVPTRSDARFCSGRCRQAYHRELTSLATSDSRNETLTRRGQHFASRLMDTNALGAQQRLGRIERAVLDQVERDRESLGYVVLAVQDIAYAIFGRPSKAEESHPIAGALDWRPTRAQYVSTLRAVRSIIRKFPQYALAGGGRWTFLWLYEPGDKRSAAKVADYIQTQREFRQQRKRGEL